jgi:hypothetical protein
MENTDFLQDRNVLVVYVSHRLQLSQIVLDCPKPVISILEHVGKCDRLCSMMKALYEFRLLLDFGINDVLDEVIHRYLHALDIPSIKNWST